MSQFRSRVARRAHSASQVLLQVTLLSALAGGVLVSGRPAQSQSAVIPIFVDAAASRHPINPEVYGVNLATAAQLQELNAPLNRNGGNNTSRYNWQQNADNRANDWYFQSIPEDSPLPGGRGDAFISDTRYATAQPMLTIPTLDWVAKLGPGRSKLASFSIAKYGAQTDRDWQWYPDAGNGVSAATGQPLTGNDPNDANVPSNAAFQQGWVQQLVAKWGPAAQGGLRYYILDNEPSIWFSTHRDVKPVGPKMDEIRDKLIEYGRMIKAQDPGAQVVGPEEWGWSGYLYSGYDQQWGAKNGWGGALPDRAAHGGKDYLPWLLDQLRQNELTTGQRVLDVFTVHYYPQGGEFSSDTSTAMQLRRNRSTRSLWDPNYVDETWINSNVQLVPRLKGWVDAYYPGTRIGLTEYSWGADNHINGATTQADVYGILGREGLDLATRWTTPASNTPTFQAMKLYRNYDGNKSTFGDVSVAATVPNPDNLSAFAAVRSSDQALTVMVVNKSAAASPLSVSLANYSVTNSTAQAWQLTAGTGIRRLADVSSAGGSIQTTVPAQSISLFVVGGASAPPPTTPAFTGTASAAPTTVAATATSTFSASLTNTGAALPGGTVDLQVWSPAGAQVAQKQFSAQDFASGQSRSYTYAWTAPVTVGTYTLKVRVLAANGTALYLNESAATVTVTGPTVPSPTFTATATVAPASVTTTGTATVTATVKATGAAVTGSLIDVEIYNSGGTKVAQQTYPAQDFTSGQSRTYTYPWAAPATPGVYTVKLGVFSADWSKNYTWNDQAATVTVTAPTATPTFTATVTAAKSPAPTQVPVVLTATVKDTGGAASGAIVDVEIVGPNGSRVLQQLFTGQDFTAGQTRTYTFNWTPPATAGKYVVGVGVFARDWTAQYTWISGAGTVDVTASTPAPPSFTGTGSFSPASVATGGAATATATFTNNGGATTGTVLDLELFNAAGSRVGQKTFPAQDFTAGQSRTVSWALAAPTTTGTYTLKLGVFAANGTTQLYWNNSAGTLTVTAPAPAGKPTFTSSATVGSGPFTVGQPIPITVKVTATGAPLADGLIDVEIYDAGGKQVLQQLFTGQSFTAGQTRSYLANWTPKAKGSYQIHVGVFGKGWSGQYDWNWQAGSVTVK